MTVHWPPVLRKPMVKRNSSRIRSPLGSVPAQRIRAVTNATSLPAEMFISPTSKTTGSRDQEKNSSHVFLYASILFDCAGGGTSNINISGEWLAKNPIEILAANRSCRVLNQAADRGFIRRSVLVRAHLDSLSFNLISPLPFPPLSSCFGPDFVRPFNESNRGRQNRQ